MGEEESNLLSHYSGQIASHTNLAIAVALGWFVIVQFYQSPDIRLYSLPWFILGAAFWFLAFLIVFIYSRIVLYSRFFYEVLWKPGGHLGDVHDSIIKRVESKARGKRLRYSWALRVALSLMNRQDSLKPSVIAFVGAAIGTAFWISVAFHLT